MPSKEYNAKYHKEHYGPALKEKSKKHMQDKRERMGEEAWKAWRKEISTKSRKQPKNRERERNHLFLKKYGITTEQRDFLAEQQEHKCRVCSEITKHLVVDHCHSTGKIRGLLCRSCNAAIGALGDTPEGIQRAIDYLNAPVQHNLAQPLQDQHEPHQAK